MLGGNQWNAGFLNLANSFFNYTYGGFGFVNNGVNLSVNTPWGGGTLSFPVNSIYQGARYVVPDGYYN